MLVSLLPPTNGVWGKVTFSVACVKNSVHMGGCLPQCMLGYHPPRTRHPPKTRHPPLLGPGIPQEQTPLGPGIPPAQCMLGDTVNKRAVCILLECNLVIEE